MLFKGKTVLQKLVSLCGSHGYASPRECLVKNKIITSYSYGAVGTLMRTNFIREWWKATTYNKHNVYQVDGSSLIRSSADIQSLAEENETNTDAALFGMLDQYLSTLQLVNRSLPFGTAQLIVRRRQPDLSQMFIAGSHEKTDLILQHFVPPHQSSQWMDELQRLRLSWWKQLSQYPAHYSVADQSSENNKEVHDVNIMFQFPWDSQPVESITNYGDEPLIKIQEETGLSHQGQYEGKAVLPHVIECRTSVEQGMLSYLVDAYTERTTAKKDEVEVCMMLHPKLAGFKTAVVVDPEASGQNADHLQELADHLVLDLRSSLLATLHLRDTTTPLQQQLLQYDRMAIPLTVILEKDTLTSGAVMLRQRNTTLKEKINLTTVKDKVISYVTKYK